MLLQVLFFFFFHSFSFSKYLILVRVSVDLERGTLGTWQEYTLDDMHSIIEHQAHTHLHIHLHLGVIQHDHRQVFERWQETREPGGNLCKHKENMRNSIQTVACSYMQHLLSIHQILFYLNTETTENTRFSVVLTIFQKRQGLWQMVLSMFI